MTTNTLIDLPTADLAEQAVKRGEGKFASNGAIVVETGARTGRSPKDRFIVDEPSHQSQSTGGKLTNRYPQMSSIIFGIAQVHIAEHETFLSHLHEARTLNITCRSK